ncbi:ERCC4-related helicase [Aeromicrobium panaciterrae]|uniref:ERCC4-related helicase n=1 Tax=Aeromicrobium panaciterrae TaxID=363861 RepID=A0ABU1UNU0_9ACTN|nr:SNF2-related protein [Aeromicrobium panaciterrae]MDR7086836.1 ERCC4-related helicase [Aeromicrobium panaciterrae]
MHENLVNLGTVIRDFLAENLPKMGPDWWDRGVIGALSFPQRSTARDRDWASLADLDFAALLRVLDQNWEFFRGRKFVSYDARNWVKEASSIRNRWAHQAPGHEPAPSLVYRDIDTLALLATELHADAAGTQALSEARVSASKDLAPSDTTTAQPPEYVQPHGLAPGSKVRLKARPDVIGAVLSISDSPGERRVGVFHGQVTQTYFESQLELVEEPTGDQLTADELKARLTAAYVLHPAVTRLYSLNSGRIDYEPYQYRPVMKLISADRPRLLIADDVGVGKTIEAGLIIKELQARQKLDSILVICPKPLVVEHKWRDELRRFDEDFAQLDSATLRHCIEETRSEGHWPARYRKAIVPYSLLDERLLLGDESGHRPRTGLASLMPPAKFDLVIVDEAHHVRNSDTWSHRVVKHFLDAAEAAVLISATPIQTGSDDLKTLLRLLRPDLFGETSAFELMRQPNSHLASVEQAIRGADEEWQLDALLNLEEALATTWGAKVLLADPRAQELHDLLEDHEIDDRERVQALRLTQSLNTFSGLINRTRRRDIGSFTTRKPETLEVDFTSEQEAVYDDLLELAGRITRESGAGQSLDFILSTLKRQAASCLNGLAPFVDDLLTRKLSLEELSEADVDLEKLDTTEIEGFVREITDLAARAAKLDDDPKLDTFLGLVGDKQELPNNKLLVFSTFRHTLGYLNAHLESTPVRVGLVHGMVPDDVRRELRARFAKPKEDPEAIDVLLSSEVGTEGLDYQFCDYLVNYDIPWNPMRIEQRIGRIDRRGQVSETVAIKNLVVSNTVDAVIFHRCLERIGVFQRALGGSEVILGELTREIRTIGDDLQLTPDERDLRLRQLADNKIAKIQEQQELEERESSLFGLSLKHLDDDGVEQAASPWLAPDQLARLVVGYLRDQGYERADTLFDRQVAVFRPDKEVRSALLVDLKSSSRETSSWERWLATPSEQSRRLTFDPKSATSSEIELLSPVHDLVRAAAVHNAGFPAHSTFSMVVESNDLPAGVHPVSIHGWTYLGSREDFELVLTTATNLDPEQSTKMLLNGSDAAVPGQQDATPELDELHYIRWSDARGAHVERTRVHIESQSASLRTTHGARVQLIEDQLSKANDDRIRRMRESELATVEADFDARSHRLAQDVERSELTSELLCRGLIEVIHG